MNFTTLYADVHIPTVATGGSAGLDLYVYVPPGETISIKPQSNTTLHTGLAFEIPIGFVGLLAPRSGVGSKWLCLRNTIGVIDSDYRGEIMAKVHNHSDELISLTNKSKPLFQLLILPYHSVLSLNYKETLEVTDRGVGGFGSTDRCGGILHVGGIT